MNTETDTNAMTVTATQPFEPANEVTAIHPDEMKQAQSGMVAFFENKVKQCKGEEREAVLAYEHAVKRKWSAGALKRIADRAGKRVAFYWKVLEALRHGFVIIPNLPCTAFAIRTDKNSPLKMLSMSSGWNNNREQESTGKGEYKNPFPLILERGLEKETTEKVGKKIYWAESWEDIEFPVAMAKPQIMEATTRAMALEIFDDLAILPQDTRRADPMIIARIYDRSHLNPYGGKKHTTFLVAWHVDLRII